MSPCTLSNVFDHYLMYFDGLQAPKVSKVMLQKLNRYRLRRFCVEIFQQSTDNIYMMQILSVFDTGSSQTVSMKSPNIDNLCLGFCTTRKQRRRRRILYILVTSAAGGEFYVFTRNLSRIQIVTFELQSTCYIHGCNSKSLVTPPPELLHRLHNNKKLCFKLVLKRSQV